MNITLLSDLKDVISFSDPISNLFDGALSNINIWTILLRIFLSVIFASILGFERANKRHTAGLRTFILVSLSSALGALLDMYFIIYFNEIFPAVSVALIIAIAIISSNTLLYSSKNQIKGLTTSVALWSSAFIGLTLGAGLYTIGIIGFVILYITLSILPSIESYLKNRSNHFEIHLELKNKTDLQLFTSVIRKLGLRIDDIESNPAYLNSGLSVYSISLTISSSELKKYKSHSEIIEALKSLEYINCIEEIN